MPRFRTGSKTREKKSVPRSTDEYLSWALNDFSGYFAIDELYDGPFAIVSIVDNRTYKRLMYEVLDHSPTHADIIAFLRRFKSALDARGLVVRGITTDGSHLYPEPFRQIFPDAKHQICQFHILDDINNEILHAVAQCRKKLDRMIPRQPRGRPSGKCARRRSKMIEQRRQKVADLFEHRYLFVRRDLTEAEMKTLLRITRGVPKLRVLRSIMDEVYRLFDRRCRTQTALRKLEKLRRKVRKIKNLDKVLRKLFSGTLEKALTFLDDSLLQPTSNAVERGNRRYRKMQKSVYRVRTHQAIICRIAMDLLRDMKLEGRRKSVAALHLARAG